MVTEKMDGAKECRLIQSTHNEKSVSKTNSCDLDHFKFLNRSNASLIANNSADVTSKTTFENMIRALLFEFLRIPPIPALPNPPSMAPSTLNFTQFAGGLDQTQGWTKG
ncbi:hypothetical protein V6N12_045694 [Hibiscus sabdariffa]|uniref:Uncharacterized protein n=1 Tax=Hibiscus sabdariffa TaxID=183260 RepID=A0ABR2G3G5_9ROSI